MRRVLLALVALLVLPVSSFAAPIWTFTFTADRPSGYQNESVIFFTEFTVDPLSPEPLLLAGTGYSPSPPLDFPFSAYDEHFVPTVSYFGENHISVAPGESLLVPMKLFVSKGLAPVGDYVFTMDWIAAGITHTSTATFSVLAGVSDPQFVPTMPVVPEPASLALFGVAAAFTLRRRLLRG